MDYQNYFAATTVSSDEMLDDWRWLIGPRLRLWRVSKSGDAFLHDPDDQSIHFLDTIGGRTERIASSLADFESMVCLGENANKWLMPEIVDAQALLGMHPGPNECLSFKHPPALGGEIDPDNFETCSIPVHFSITGQIHRQIKDLPPGTPVRNIKIGAPRSTDKRHWWKFW